MQDSHVLSDVLFVLMATANVNKAERRKIDANATIAIVSCKRLSFIHKSTCTVVPDTDWSVCGARRSQLSEVSMLVLGINVDGNDNWKFIFLDAPSLSRAVTLWLSPLLPYQRRAWGDAINICNCHSTLGVRIIRFRCRQRNLSLGKRLMVLRIAFDFECAPLGIAPPRRALQLTHNANSSQQNP